MWASIICCGDSAGKGRDATITFAAVRSLTKFRALRQALYFWSVVNNSSVGEKLSERNTAFTPVLAFGTNINFSDYVPTNFANFSLPSSSRVSNSRTKKMYCFCFQLFLGRCTVTND
ncbi:MAG: hypothetical protein F6K18_30610 [Okeania sp. SIO2C2]|nr:hypothetical protein [Okeania sp. SIO2C2]